MTLRRYSRRLLATLAMTMAPLAALADDSSVSGWTVTAAPYLWAAGLDGTVDQGPVPAVDVDASFGDILENLDIAVMGVTEARNGRFGLLADVQYVRVSNTATNPAGIAATSTEVTATLTTLFGAGMWQVVDSGGVTLDLVGGARVWSAETEIAFSGGLLGGRTFSDERTWVDPMLGAYGRQNLTRSLFLTGWAMYGGFGIESDSAWDLMAAVGYEAWDGVSLVGGWRTLSVDYADGGFVYDIVQSGPLLGVAITF